MDGQLVEFKFLPSRGLSYPKDIEIYVRPLSIKEQIDITRYGISTAEYYQTILNGITIHGTFNKNNLLQADVQFMDIVRRIYSFDTQDKIIVKDETCIYPDCGAPVEFSFTMDQIDFSDFSEDIFGKEFTFGAETEDELTVVVSPLTISEYIAMSKEFKNYTDRRTAQSNIFLEYMCRCIREVKDREFKSMKERDAFLKGYIGNLWSAKDKKVLQAIEDETTIQVKPFKVICDTCGRETEVTVSPTSNFQQ